jgi:F-type H+-transporting ATPase subunit c
MKLMKLAFLVAVVFLVVASPALAYTEKVKTASGETEERGGPDTAVFAGAAVAAGLGMGLTIIGAGIGLGRIGSAAMEGMARQPEVAPRIQTAMLIIAAMLEGATLASVILSFLVGGTARW